MAQSYAQDARAAEEQVSRQTNEGNGIMLDQFGRSAFVPSSSFVTKWKPQPHGSCDDSIETRASPHACCLHSFFHHERKPLSRQHTKNSHHH
jgi:hypothetical protein